MSDTPRCNALYRDRLNSSDDLAWKSLAVSLERECASLTARLEEAEKDARRDWRPLESAPKDGTEVLIQVAFRAGIPGRMLVGHYMQGGHCIEDHPPIDQGWYFWNGCMFDKAAKPLAWMPLPAALADTGKK